MYVNWQRWHNRGLAAIIKVTSWTISTDYTWRFDQSISYMICRQNFKKSCCQDIAKISRSYFESSAQHQLQSINQYQKCFAMSPKYPWPTKSYKFIQIYKYLYIWICSDICSSGSWRPTSLLYSTSLQHRGNFWKMPWFVLVSVISPDKVTSTRFVLVSVN